MLRLICVSLYLSYSLHETMKSKPCFGAIQRHAVFVVFDNQVNIQGF